MSGAKVVRVRNVNEALRVLRDSKPHADHVNWRVVSPRGKETWEHRGPYITEYIHPEERVLFSTERDANPFFHFFEALWILAGRQDVAFLKMFNSNIAQYSDNGETFNAPYGLRLRSHFGYDQIEGAIRLLSEDPDTRRCVLTIWDVADMCKHSNDIPCNDMIFFKIRDGALEMTVNCRSNDAIWGAYGANAVQFSFIQELIAQHLGLSIGPYRQVSDSFHIYTDNDAWHRLNANAVDGQPVAINDLYGVLPDMQPFGLCGEGEYHEFMDDLTAFMKWVDHPRREAPVPRLGFFQHVVYPLWNTAMTYKQMGYSRAIAVDYALDVLYDACAASDWKLACANWLQKRRDRK